MRTYIVILLLCIFVGCSYARSVESYFDNPPIAVEAQSDQYGKTYERTVTATRIMSPVGVSPGETISRQQGATINNKGFQGGGSNWSWIDSIWQTLKDWFWGLLLIVIVLLMLPLFFPALIPLFNSIISGIGRFLAWIIPVLGGAIESLKHKATTKATSELVESQENFKSKIRNCEVLDEDVKDLVLTHLKNSNIESQDHKTQKAVDRHKGKK